MIAAPIQKLRAIVFDFDGTLADSIEQALGVLNRLAEEHQFRRVESADLPHVKNLSATQFAKYLGLKRRQIPRVLFQGKRMLAQDIDKLEPIPGITEVVRDLRERVPVMGILTSNSQENVNKFLKSNDLGVFDFVSSIPKLTGKSKHLKSVLRTYSLSPGQLAYVGDEMRDIKAAHKARVFAVAVTWGFNSVDALMRETPHAIVESSKELDKLLCQRVEGKTLTDPSPDIAV